MAQHKRVFLIVFFAVAGMVILTAGGCGGGPAETSTSPTTIVASDRIIDEAAVGQMQGDGFQQLAGEAADGLVARHGGDEAAFLATLLALDGGYDVYQLLTAALNDRLAADGRITTADGSPLSPAREPQGVIELAASGPILVASLSNPLLLADSPPSPADAVISTGGATVTVDEVFQKVLERRKLLQEQAESGEATLAPEEWLQGYVTYWTILLGARGYSAAQIAQGLIMHAEKGATPDIVEDSGVSADDEYMCVYIQHTSGVMLKPKYPPVDLIQEMVCPVAPKDAPELFVPEEVKAAAAGAAAPGGEGGDVAPDLPLLNGTWKGTLNMTKASVEGMDVSEMQMEGCDPSDTLRVTHKITGELTLEPDGSGTISWIGDSVGLESSGLVESLPGGSASVDWTWQKGRLQIAAKPESGGTLDLEATFEVQADKTYVLDGTWNATGTEVLDEEVLNLVASGIFTVTKPHEP